MLERYRSCGTMMAGVTCVALLVAGCSILAPGTELAPLETASVSGSTLWTRVTVEADYTGYGQWPGHEGVQPGQSPHGGFHRIYLNDTLRDALPVTDKVAPVGSIIVKENLNADHQLMAVTVMAKVDGYAPQTGDWYWAKYSATGDVQAEGTPAGCIGCHGGMADNDYVIVHPLESMVELPGLVDVWRQRMARVLGASASVQSGP